MFWRFILKSLNFLTAGMPLATTNKSYEGAFSVLSEMGLDGLELEFVRGVRMSDVSFETVKRHSKDFLITAHGPFFINLNAKEPDKIEASIRRIIETAQMASAVGAYSITYHAAYYLDDTAEVVYKRVVDRTAQILDVLNNENISIWVRPETTGKPTQWGTLDEIIKLSKEFPQVLPCVDFSHMHARSVGGFNNYSQFCRILEKMEKNLGREALDNFHGHIAGIEYTERGERKHLNLEKSDMDYKGLLRALKKFEVKGALVCESPNIETDCKLLKEYYNSL